MIQNETRNAIPTLRFFNDDDNSNGSSNSNSNNNNNNNNNNVSSSISTIEELSNKLLRKIIRGRKVAIIGDSTLRNLVRWLVCLYDERSKDLFWMNNNNNNNNNKIMKKKNKSRIDSIINLGDSLGDGNNINNDSNNDSSTSGTIGIYRANKDILRIGFQTSLSSL